MAIIKQYRNIGKWSLQQYLKQGLTVRNSDGSGEKVKSRVSVVRKVRLREHQVEEGLSDILRAPLWLMLLGYWARGYGTFFSVLFVHSSPFPTVLLIPKALSVWTPWKESIAHRLLVESLKWDIQKKISGQQERKFELFIFLDPSVWGPLGWLVHFYLIS